MCVCLIYFLLPLGPGDSGKSTIAKQMNLLHGEGFTEEDIADRRQHVFINLVDGMSSILQALGTLCADVNTDDLQPYITEVVQATNDTSIFSNRPSVSVFEALGKLWADQRIKEMYARRHEYQVDECIG